MGVLIIINKKIGNDYLNCTQKSEIGRVLLLLLAWKGDNYKLTKGIAVDLSLMPAVRLMGWLAAWGEKIMRW